MKKFWIYLVTAVFLFFVVCGATLCIMASVHDHSVKTELFNWFPALEKTIEDKETSKDDDVVIEDETQTEEETEGEETGDEEIIVEEETQTE